MRIFGWNLHAKREPRWAPYEAFAALAEQVNEMSKVISATQRKVYRDTNKDEVAEVLGKPAEPAPKKPSLVRGPGEILSQDEVNRIFRGEE